MCYICSLEKRNILKTIKKLKKDFIPKTTVL